MASISKILKLSEFYISFWGKQAELYTVVGFGIISVVIYCLTLNYYFTILILSPIPLFIYNLYKSDNYLKENLFFVILNIQAIERIHVKLLLIYILTILSISFLFISIKLTHIQTNIDFSKLYFYVSFLLFISLNLQKIKSTIIKWIILILSINTILVFTMFFNLIINSIIITILIITTLILNKNEYLNKF